MSFINAGPFSSTSIITTLPMFLSILNSVATSVLIGATVIPKLLIFSTVLCGSCSVADIEFSATSSSPRTTVNCWIFPSLHTSTLTFDPTSVSATILGNSFIFSILLPSNDKTISPAFIFAASAGLSGLTELTNAPLVSLKSREAAISSVTSCMYTPSQPRRVLPNSTNCLTTELARFDEIANPIPTEPPDWEKIAVFTPITLPDILKRGPPEFPLLIDASVCIKSSYCPWPISLPLADTIPAVTVPPKPKGFPTARTQSPTLKISESPKLTKGSFSPFVSTFKTAKSVLVSLPIILAINSLSSGKNTDISSAPSITWLFVTIRPSSLIIKPEPNAVDGLLDGPLSLKSLKNSSNGEPGGKFGISLGGESLTATLVAIFTTAGDTLSDRSAKLSGGALAKLSKHKLKIKTKIVVFKRIKFLLYELFFRIPYSILQITSK